MRVDPAIQALRGDRSRQRLAQAGVEGVKSAWLALPRSQRLARDLESYAKGRPLAGCGELSALFDGKQAGLFDRLVEDMLAAIACEPLARVPFRHTCKQGFAALQLLASGGAALSLALYDASANGMAARARSIAFQDCERHELVLAGSAEIRIVRRSSRPDGGALLDFESRRLGPGSVLSFAGVHSAKLVDRVEVATVILRLGRTPANPCPVEEFDLATGALLHRASGRKAESQRELAMELLGRMGRSDAAPAIERAAMQGSEHLRWQAMRECLALDTARGFALLSRIAADPADGLSAPAGALRAQLVETYPQLEAGPCPA